MKKSTLLGWTICLLAALFYAYDFLLRVMPSIMVHPLMHTFDANAAQIGVLSAFYYYAYTPLQLPAGIIVDKYSPRWVLSISALLCAFGALIFGSTDNLMVANLSRAMMGIGSAFAFVGALKLGAIWLPANRFALFAGLTTTLGTIGAIFADNILSFMVKDLGWRHTAFVSGIAGLLLAALMFAFIQNRQQERHKSLHTEEFHSWHHTFKRMLTLAKNKTIWLNGIVGACLFVPISVFASLWGVDFFARAYELSHTKAASAISLIFIGMAVASPLAGHLSETLNSRKIPLLIGNIGCLVSISCLIYLDHVPLFIGYSLLFLIGTFCSPQILVFAIAKDLSPPLTTGISTSLTNFIVTIGAALFQPLIGYALDLVWQGKKTALGTPYFSLHDYRVALSFLVGSLVFSLLLIVFLPKYTHPR